MARTRLNDFLDYVPVPKPDVTGVHLRMVIARHRGELHLNVAGRQRYLPWLRLHFHLACRSAVSHIRLTLRDQGSITMRTQLSRKDCQLVLRTVAATPVGRPLCTPFLRQAQRSRAAAQLLVSSCLRRAGHRRACVDSHCWRPAHPSKARSGHATCRVNANLMSSSKAHQLLQVFADIRVHDQLVKLARPMLRGQSTLVCWFAAQTVCSQRVCERKSKGSPCLSKA